jgi:hypothetical protein
VSNESTTEAVDYDWSSSEADFPSVEVPSGETGNETSDSESVSEDTDSISGESGEVIAEESNETTDEAQNATEEAPSGEEKGGSEDSGREVELSEALQEKGLVSQDGKVGKLVKIDGEEQFVSLEDLGNDFSGQKAIAKRFSEYDRKEKEFQAQIDEVNGYVNTFAEKMQAKDPVAAMEYLAQFAGIPPYEIKDMLVDAVRPEIERRLGLSDVELDLEKQQSKLEYDKKLTESEQQKVQQQAHHMELQQKIQGVRDTHSIEQGEWDGAFEYLDSNLPPSEDINISMVKERVLFSRAEAALNEVDSNLLSDPSIAGYVVQIQEQYPNFDSDDLVAVVREAFKGEKADQAEQNLQEAQQTKKQKTVSQPKSKVEEIQPLEDWDDL